MKEYFSHDYKARADRKLVNLHMKLGVAGIGCFWCITEMLYEEGGIMPMECERIAFELRTQCDIVKQVINDFELFDNDGEFFWSDSIKRRLNDRKEVSVKARLSANKRWGKVVDANAMPTQCNGNANKEKKSKVNKKKYLYINTLKKAWFEFYFSEIGNQYHFTGADAKALGIIETNLLKSFGSTEVNDVLMVKAFRKLLDNLSDWERNNLSLKVVGSHYNEIVSRIKTIKQLPNKQMQKL